MNTTAPASTAPNIDRGGGARSRSASAARPGSATHGDTCTRLAAGFEVGVATAWRYVQEVIALSRRQEAVNCTHANIRAVGNGRSPTFKTWILATLRCCPRRATVIVRAILVLHHVEPVRLHRRRAGRQP
jgi:hypothetical protein